MRRGGNFLEESQFFLYPELLSRISGHNSSEKGSQLARASSNSRFSLYPESSVRSEGTREGMSKPPWQRVREETSSYQGNSCNTPEWSRDQGREGWTDRCQAPRSQQPYSGMLRVQDEQPPLWRSRSQGSEEQGWSYRSRELDERDWAITSKEPNEPWANRLSECDERTWAKRARETEPAYLDEPGLVNRSSDPEHAGWINNRGKCEDPDWMSKSQDQGNMAWGNQSRGMDKPDWNNIKSEVDGEVLGRMEERGWTNRSKEPDEWDKCMDRSRIKPRSVWSRLQGVQNSPHGPMRIRREDEVVFKKARMSDQQSYIRDKTSDWQSQGRMAQEVLPLRDSTLFLERGMPLPDFPPIELLREPKGPKPTKNVVSSSPRENVVMIVPRGKKRNLTPADADSLRDLLVKEIVILATSANVEEQPELKFNDCVLDRGRLVIYCHDSTTVNWMMEWQPCLVEPKKKLRVVLPSDLTSPAVICFLIKGVGGLNRDFVSNRIQMQNQGLDVPSWKQGITRSVRRGQIFYFMVDGHSLRYMEAHSWCIFYEMQKIHVRHINRGSVISDNI